MKLWISYVNAKTQNVWSISSIHTVAEAVWREVQYFLCVIWQLEVVQHICLSNLRKRNKTWKSRLCCIIMDAFGSTSALTAWWSIARVKCTLGHSQCIVNICTHDISRYTSAGRLVDSTFHPSSSHDSGTNSTHLAAGSVPLNVKGFISISGWVPNILLAASLISWRTDYTVTLKTTNMVVILFWQNALCSQNHSSISQQAFHMTSSPLRK